MTRFSRAQYVQPDMYADIESGAPASYVRPGAFRVLYYFHYDFGVAQFTPRMSIHIATALFSQSHILIQASTVTDPQKIT